MTEERRRYLEAKRAVLEYERKITAPKGITPRQKEMLELLSQGYVVKEIANVMNISPNTVRNMSANIQERLGALNVTHAIAIAFKKGYISLNGVGDE